MSTESIKWNLNSNILKTEVEKWRKAYESFSVDDHEKALNNKSFKFDGELVISTPATELEIQEKEKELGINLPPSLRYFFLKITKDISFLSAIYNSPNYRKLPNNLKIWGGCAYLSLKNLSMEEVVVPSNPNDEWYRERWQNKLEIINIGNGDVIALNLIDQKILYIDHESNDNDFIELADNFATFFDNWLDIGLTSLEMYNLKSFLIDGRLDSKSNTATLWRKIMLSGPKERTELLKSIPKEKVKKISIKNFVEGLIILLIAVAALIMDILSKQTK